MIPELSTPGIERLGSGTLCPSTASGLESVQCVDGQLVRQLEAEPGTIKMLHSMKVDIGYQGLLSSEYEPL